MRWQYFDSRRNVVLASLGVALGIVLALVIRSSMGNQPGKTSQVQTTHQESMGDVVGRHLGWADQEVIGGLAPQLAPVRDFFQEARSRTRLFAEDALGFNSKWKLASDYFSGGKEHQQFLEERFAARIFSPEQLAKVVEQAAAGYLRHLDDVDAIVLVNLQADLADASPGELRAGVDPQAIGQALDTAIRDAVRAVEADFRGLVGQQLVSFVAGEVLTLASIEFATSAGILSVGASSGVVTFGVGIIVGIIVDYIVSWAYDKLVDPAGEMSSKLNQKLSELENLILFGNGVQAGLEGRLQEYAQRRSQVRNVAIQSAVLP